MAMTLSQITDPEAVKQAIAEFDRLGRDEFLRKYGFGRSVRYYLMYEGRPYDSKAILGAAHGVQFPERGPLTATDFHGGENTVAPKLRSLGFDVVVEPHKDRTRLEEPEELVEEVANPLRRRGGQGRGLSAEERRAVERRAMDLAIAHYERRWKSVRDVGGTECFDLECQSGRQVLRVEVKGTTGGGDSVLLTANEVEHARTQAPHMALFVVSEIQLDRGPEPVASGGIVRILEPWDIGTCRLRAVAFECALPSA